MKIFKLSQSGQDFGGYFQGEVPDYAAGLIGTPSVDASQVQASFGKTEEALNLVNSFTPDALTNVAYVFNFSKGGAYGVYVPALDRAIKTKALQKQLESKGYKIVEEKGGLTAYPTKEDKNPEEIENEIKTSWETLSSQGGTAIGINISGVLNAASQNASSILSDMQSSGKQVPPQVNNILKDILSVYHVAATIVHEASHAKGGDEGKAETDESAFRSWAQGKINDQYKTQLSSNGLDEFYSPLELGSETIHAKSNNWYKMAQYFPGALFGKPTGSDLEGRFNKGRSGEGMADWAMVIQHNKDLPIEKKLSREYMFPLSQDIDIEKNIIEEQLRKQNDKDDKPDARLIMEELLSASHNESASYNTLESLLEDTRPKPLMLPIKKASFDLIKEATLFGWYNNLSISDGSTIPGLGDRVMAWDDRDEDFAWSDSDIRNQPRYNPEYDIKDFYYRWIEPRFKPQLWDEMVEEDTANVHPAKRFAEKTNGELLKIVNILGLIQRSISEGSTKATRLIASHDIAPFIEKFFAGNDGIETQKYSVGESTNGDIIFSIWIFHNKIPQSAIHHSEHYFQHKDMSADVKEISESILGTKEKLSKSIEEIINSAKEICDEYGINDLYVVGSYVREKIMNEKIDVNEINFIRNSKMGNMKAGKLLAKKLGVKDVRVSKPSMTLTFSYKGIRVDFEGEVDIGELKGYLPEQQANLSNQITNYLCNRDFTINMAAYNISSGKIEDPLGIIKDIKSKVIRSYLDPQAIIRENPIIIMRALKLKLKYGFEIEEDLERAIIENAYLLFDGRYSEGRLIFARESVKEEDREGADALFEEFGLSKIKEIGETKCQFQ